MPTHITDPPQNLCHFSEESGIARFEPRPPPSASSGVTGLVVWAVAPKYQANYLLPRDCPRVTFGAKYDTSDADRKRFLIGVTARRVVCVETAWLPRIRAATLFRYDLAPEPFVDVDAERDGGKCFIARVPVEPLRVVALTDLLHELTAEDIELRILPDLWPLCDAVAASSLEFSMIRMRNARPHAS